MYSNYMEIKRKNMDTMKDICDKNWVYPSYNNLFSIENHKEGTFKMEVLETKVPMAKTYYDYRETQYNF